MNFQNSFIWFSRNNQKCQIRGIPRTLTVFIWIPVSEPLAQNNWEENCNGIQELNTGENVGKELHRKLRQKPAGDEKGGHQTAQQREMTRNGYHTRIETILDYPNQRQNEWHTRAILILCCITGAAGLKHTDNPPVRTETDATQHPELSPVAVLVLWGRSH